MTEEGGSPGPDSEGHVGEGLSGWLMPRWAHRQKERAESKTWSLEVLRSWRQEGLWHMDGTKLPRLGPKQECDLIKDRATSWSGIQADGTRHLGSREPPSTEGRVGSPLLPIHHALPTTQKHRGEVFIIPSHCQGLINYTGTSKMITIWTKSKDNKSSSVSFATNLLSPSSYSSSLRY